MNLIFLFFREEQFCTVNYKKNSKTSYGLIVSGEFTDRRKTKLLFENTEKVVESLHNMGPLRIAPCVHLYRINWIEKADK